MFLPSFAHNWPKSPGLSATTWILVPNFHQVLPSVAMPKRSSSSWTRGQTSCLSRRGRWWMLWHGLDCVWFCKWRAIYLGLCFFGLGNCFGIPPSSFLSTVLLFCFFALFFPFPSLLFCFVIFASLLVCFSAFLFFCFYAASLLFCCFCVSAFLFFCFSESVFLLFCFFAFLLFCFSGFLYLFFLLLLVLFCLPLCFFASLFFCLFVSVFCFSVFCSLLCIVSAFVAFYLLASLSFCLTTSAATTT